MLDATEAKASHGLRKYVRGWVRMVCGFLVDWDGVGQGRFDGPDGRASQKGTARNEGEKAKGQGERVRERSDCVLGVIA